MNTSEHNYIRAKHLEIEAGYLWIFLEDGRILRVRQAEYPRLAHATRKQLGNFRWIGKGLGIHWPDLDEDLSIEGFLKANTKSFILSSGKPVTMQTVNGLTLLPITKYQEKVKERTLQRRAVQ